MASSWARQASYEKPRRIITEDDYIDDDMPEHVLYAKLGITIIVVTQNIFEIDKFINTKLAEALEEQRLEFKKPPPSFAEVHKNAPPPPLVRPAYELKPLYVVRKKRQDREELIDYRIEVDESNHDLDDIEDFALDMIPDDQIEDLVLRSAWMDCNKGKQWPNIDALLADIRARKQQVKGISRKLGMKSWPAPKKVTQDRPSKPSQDPKPARKAVDPEGWTTQFNKSEVHRKKKMAAEFAVLEATRKAQAREIAENREQARKSFQKAITCMMRTLIDERYSNSNAGEEARKSYISLCTIADNESDENQDLAVEYLAKMDMQIDEERR
ncbi:hypothetical protein FKW77_005920 [Venturia effusa]|uniref:Uncharacterized protein n=1 Tax=Venturia effusa TaxID=50376 RepID=A0A517LIY6_9PEZI|nr:hypothetical protein FKW77_005920 [Venturia effusa]